jgi:hypothetical protein
MNYTAWPIILYDSYQTSKELYSQSKEGWRHGRTNEHMDKHEKLYVPVLSHAGHNKKFM